jgi:hypothetical protein
MLFQIARSVPKIVLAGSARVDAKIVVAGLEATES